MKLVGRQLELDAIASTLAHDGVLAIVGPSGMGKSMLAAHYCGGRNTTMIDCFAASEAEIVGALATELALPTGGSTRETWVLAADALSDTDILLLDDVGVQIDSAVLRDVITCPVLITTHNPLEGVPSLPLHAWAVGTMAGLRETDPFKAFVAAAQHEDVTFTVGDDELQALHDIVARLHGHPLGLALAGRRAATVGVHGVLDLLDQEDELIDPRRPGRHASLDTALRFSWAALTPDDQRRLFVMSLFRRPLRAAALAAICDEDPAQTLEAVHRLVRGGVVSRGRFPRALELFIDVAREQFEQAEPDDAAHLFSRIAAEAVAEARKQPRGLERRERPNMGEGPSFWQFVFEADGCDLEPADLGLVAASWCRWMSRRQAAQGSSFDRERLDRLLEKTADPDAYVQAACLFTRRDPGESLIYSTRALELATSDADRHAALLTRADGLVNLFELDEADAALDEAAPLGSSAELHTSRAQVRNMRGRYDEAAQELSLAEEAGPTPIQQAFIEVLRVFTRTHPRDPTTVLKESAQTAYDGGNLRFYAGALMAHGSHAGRVGDLADARESFAAARAMFIRLGELAERDRVDAMESTILLNRGEFESARSICHEVIERSDGFASGYCKLNLLSMRWIEGDASLSAGWEAQRERWSEYRGTDVWRMVDVCLSEGSARRKRLRVHQRAVPESSAVFNALFTFSRLDPAASFGELLSAWAVLRPAFIALNPLDADIVRAANYLTPRMPHDLRLLKALEDLDADVVIEAQFRAYRVGDRWVDLSTQSVAMALLRALAEAQTPLDHEALGAAMYPGEYVEPDALVNRVNVQVAKLRKAGLKPYLAKRPAGFELVGDVVVGSEPEFV